MGQATRNREYRFIGGPAHGERKVVSDVHKTIRIPVRLDDVDLFGDFDPNTPAYKVALYVLDGDYPNEWFCRFHSYWSA